MKKRKDWNGIIRRKKLNRNEEMIMRKREEKRKNGEKIWK